MSVTDQIKAHVDTRPEGYPVGTVKVFATVTFRAERLITKQMRESSGPVDVIEKTKVHLINQVADEIWRIFG